MPLAAFLATFAIDTGIGLTAFLAPRMFLDLPPVRPLEILFIEARALLGLPKYLFTTDFGPPVRLRTPIPILLPRPGFAGSGT